MRTKIKYTEEQLAYLEYYYKLMNVRDLTIAFNLYFNQNRTEVAIKSKLIKEGISCGREPKDRLINRTRVFTEPQKLFIRENYEGRSVAEMTEIFNDYFKTQITKKQIMGFVNRNKGLISGRTGHFPKGHCPWNTGTRGLTGANKTSFKKGSIPPKTKPLGSERDDKDGYILIKVLDRNGKQRRRYKPKHVHIWEQHNGPVPKGYIIAFKDSNKRNFDISNLMAVSKTQMLFLNNLDYKNKSMQIKNSLLILTKLKTKISEIKNKFR